MYHGVNFMTPLQYDGHVLVMAKVGWGLGLRGQATVARGDPPSTIAALLRCNRCMRRTALTTPRKMWWGDAPAARRLERRAAVPPRGPPPPRAFGARSPAFPAGPSRRAGRPIPAPPGAAPPLARAAP